VVIIGRRAAVLDEAVQAIKREFPDAPNVLALTGDLAVPGEVESICNDVSERFPIVDILVNAVSRER
jgi:3-oxoacyl-[acyl-carrier protein] reductase